MALWASDIPAGLLGCTLGAQSVGICKIGEDGIVLRAASALPGGALQLHVCRLGGKPTETCAPSRYHLREVLQKPDWREYVFSVSDPAYALTVRQVILEYNRFVQLKLHKSEADCAAALTGYPAQLDAVIAPSFATQKRTWFSAVRPWHTDFTCEIAFALDTPALASQFLRQPLAAIIRQAASDNGLSNHPLLQKAAARVYFGSAWCQHLLPSPDLLPQLLGKAKADGLAVTLSLPFLPEWFCAQARALLAAAERWCVAQNARIEVEVNDWGVAVLLQSFPHLQPVLGRLLCKRRKDPRLPGPMDATLLAGNDLMHSGWRAALRTLGVTRFELETPGYPTSVPPGRHSLHLPYYQMNTSHYCPLTAVLSTGDRGAQHPTRHCGAPCSTCALLYPDHLHAVGKYNTIFGCDCAILSEEALLGRYCEQGVDRLVVTLL
ncbi:MAG: hypothetical protein PHS97_07785 [Oscillospiraceae bacterium]|nr:hypothetical protein [Oscillospiraceae bacterium]